MQRLPELTGSCAEATGADCHLCIRDWRCGTAEIRGISFGRLLLSCCVRPSSTDELHGTAGSGVLSPDLTRPDLMAGCAVSSVVLGLVRLLCVGSSGVITYCVGVRWHFFFYICE